MRRIDWQASGAPDIVERGRFYIVCSCEMHDAWAYYYDPATGQMWMQNLDERDPSKAWHTSIQTFPYGEVRNG